jgi:hypothetical protein
MSQKSVIFRASVTCERLFDIRTELNASGRGGCVFGTKPLDPEIGSIAATESVSCGTATISADDLRGETPAQDPALTENDENAAGPGQAP